MSGMLHQNVLRVSSILSIWSQSPQVSLAENRMISSADDFFFGCLLLMFVSADMFFSVCFVCRWFLMRMISLRKISLRMFVVADDLFCGLFLLRMISSADYSSAEDFFCGRLFCEHFLCGGLAIGLKAFHVLYTINMFGRENIQDTVFKNLSICIQSQLQFDGHSLHG